MDVTSEEEKKLEYSLLKIFSGLGGNFGSEHREFKSLENKIKKYFRDTGGTTPQLLDVLRILDIFEKNYSQADFRDLCFISKPIIQRLNYTHIENWHDYDINIAELVLSYTNTFEEADKFSSKILRAIKQHRSKERANKSKFNIYSNISSRLLYASFFELNEVKKAERYEKLKTLFKYNTSEALKICESEGEQARKYELIIFIRIALWDKDTDEVMKSLALLKEVGDKQRYRIMREEVAKYSDHPDFYLNEAQSTIFIGDNIRRTREQQNIAVVDVTEPLNITDSHLNAVERGENNLSIYKLMEVAKILNTTIDVLCYGKNRKPLN
ncbi:MAG: helix-turn-helix domain-containing protein [Defluviitaleaceae bacterium]|nr:helix-turn-helix domain-containing protein [Defluviitaleaceae bacterium]